MIVISLLFLLFTVGTGAESSGIYTYTVENGEATITRCDTSASGVIIIPDSLNGYPVCYIMNGAFDGCSGITEIIIPRSVKELGKANPSAITTLVPITTAPITTAPVTTAVTTGDGWTRPIKSRPPIDLPISSSEESDDIFETCSALVSLTILAPDCIINTETLSPSVTVYGYTISTAKAFADKNGNPFSDLNKDASHTYYAGALDESYDIVYFIERETKAFTIKGEGNIPDYSEQNEAPWASYSQSIVSVTIPESIKGIGDYAFASCTALQKVILEAKCPPAVSANAFLECSSLTSIIVPACYASDYKESNAWASYSDIIFPEFVYGDATGDREVTSTDVVLLRMYMADYNFNTNTSSVEVTKGADSNGDGQISSTDVVLLRMYMADYNFDTNTSSVILGPSK